jgi:hypothetical protein
VTELLSGALTEGLHAGISHARYHADDLAETPTLSASLAHLLLTRSPAHSYLAHPRLGMSRPADESSAALDTGSIIHDMLLGGGAELVVVDAKDYRTKVAQEARDAARARGTIPILPAKLAGLQRAASAIRCQIPELEGMRHEVTALWKSAGGVLCRGRMDALPQDGAAVIADLKTTANARDASRGAHAVKYGWHVSAAAYTEAVETLVPENAGRVSYLWLIAEVEEPYGVIQAAPSRELLALGARQWRRAVAMWEECLRTDHWPGYGEDLVEIEAPAWAIAEDVMQGLRANREDTDAALNDPRR